MDRPMRAGRDAQTIEVTPVMIHNGLPFDHTHGSVWASLDALTGTDTLFIVNNDFHCCSLLPGLLSISRKK